MKLKRKFWRNIAKRAIRLVIDIVALRIEDSFARESFKMSLVPAESIIDAMGDADPDDKRQIALIVQTHTNENIVPFAEQKFKEIIDSIEDDKLKEFITVTAMVPFNAAKIYTDKDPANASQLRDYLKSWAKNRKHQSALYEYFLEPLVDGALEESPETKKFLLDTLAEILNIQSSESKESIPVVKFPVT